MKAYKIMRAFKIQIVLGDDAMQTPLDVGQAIELLALKLQNMDDEWLRGLAGQPQAIKDRNGNTVGQWEVR